MRPRWNQAVWAEHSRRFLGRVVMRQEEHAAAVQLRGWLEGRLTRFAIPAAAAVPPPPQQPARNGGSSAATPPAENAPTIDVASVGAPCVLLYGSAVAGTAFRHGDADFAVAFPPRPRAAADASASESTNSNGEPPCAFTVVPRVVQPAVLSALHDHLRSDDASLRFQRIFRARVPIMQFSPGLAALQTGNAASAAGDGMAQLSTGVDTELPTRTIPTTGATGGSNGQQQQEQTERATPTQPDAAKPDAKPEATPDIPPSRLAATAAAAAARQRRLREAEGRRKEQSKEAFAAFSGFGLSGGALGGASLSHQSNAIWPRAGSPLEQGAAALFATGLAGASSSSSMTPVALAALPLLEAERGNALLFAPKPSHFDVSLSLDGVRNSLLLRSYMQRFPIARTLALVLKHWGRRRRLLSAHRGWLSPYALTIMLLHYLATRGAITLIPEATADAALAALASSAVASPAPAATDDPCRSLLAWPDASDDAASAPYFESVAELLQGFFAFYAGDGFDFDTDVVDIRTAARLPKKADWQQADAALTDAERWHRVGYGVLMIRDPFEGHSLGRSVEFFRAEALREELAATAAAAWSDAAVAALFALPSDFGAAKPSQAAPAT